MTTPCRENPEAWVSDNNQTRAEAARECANCPLHTFAACQKLAKDAPFGVMAGHDYGIHYKTPKTPKPLNVDDVKECETCAATVHRGNRSKADWDKLRFCSRKCYGQTLMIPGLPDTKVCERCGVEYGREGRAPAHWRVSRFCGVSCANAMKRRERAA